MIFQVTIHMPYDIIIYIGSNDYYCNILISLTSKYFYNKLNELDKLELFKRYYQRFSSIEIETSDLLRNLLCNIKVLSNMNITCDGVLYNTYKTYKEYIVSNERKIQFKIRKYSSFIVGYHKESDKWIRSSEILSIEDMMNLILKYNELNLIKSNKSKSNK